MCQSISIVIYSRESNWNELHDRPLIPSKVLCKTTFEVFSPVSRFLKIAFLDFFREHRIGSLDLIKFSLQKPFLEIEIYKLKKELGTLERSATVIALKARLQES